MTFDPRKINNWTWFFLWFAMIFQLNALMILILLIEWKEQLEAKL